MGALRRPYEFENKSKHNDASVGRLGTLLAQSP
jgi:hypothetical protein